MLQAEHAAKLAAEEAHRRQQALQAREAQRAKLQRVRDELYAMNKILQMSDNARAALFLKERVEQSTRASLECRPRMEENVDDGGGGEAMRVHGV
jgi:hypothetical protein